MKAVSRVLSPPAKGDAEASIMAAEDDQWPTPDDEQALQKGKDKAKKKKKGK